MAGVPSRVGNLQIHPQARRPSQQRRHLVLRQPCPLHVVVICSIKRSQRSSGVLEVCTPILWRKASRDMSLGH